MFKYEILGDGLVYYTNLIADPYKIIDDIENIDSVVTKSIESGKHNPENSVVKPWHNWDFGDLHFCKQRWLPRTEEIPLDDPYFLEYSSISDRLFDSLDTAFNHYSKEVYPYASRNLKGKEDNMSILKYEESGYLPAHTDHGSSSRTLSVVLYLNDDYEGGVISFPHIGKNGISIKPEAGSAVFFPSNYVFVHEISSVTKGTRYALPNWYHNMTKKVYTDGTE